MDTPTSTSHSEKLTPVLRRLRQRIRRLQWLWGGARVAILILGGLLILAAADYFYSPIPTVVRWLMPVVWIVAVLWGVKEWLLKPLTRKLNFVQLARWLEMRHPELEERVSTVLELGNHPNASISSSLLDDLAKSAAVDMDTIDPQTEVAGQRAKRWLWPAAALLGVWAVLFAIWPNLASRHVVRALVPNSSYGTAGTLIAVMPGDIEVIEGDSLDITARRIDGKGDEPLEIVIELSDGSEMIERMLPGDGGHGYHLGKADRSFSYVVRAGRETSDRHVVTVRPAPRLIDPRVRLEFPAYTQWKEQESGLGNAGILAIAGTRVEIMASLNTAIESATFSLDGEEAGDVRIERAADGGKLSIRFDLADPGSNEAVLSLVHPLGRKFEVLRFPVETLPDEEPTVTWIAPTQDEMKLRPDDAFVYKYEASDDVSLGRVDFEVKPQSGDMGRFPLALPDRYGLGEPMVWRGGSEQAIGALRDLWPRNRKFEVRVRVEDSRPPELGGPGIGVSEWKTIKIDDRAESLAKQELAAQHSDARETVQEARRDINEAKQKLNQPQSKPLDEQDKKELAEAREKLSEAKQKLEELAGRMKESVHEAQRDEVQKAAEELSEAVQRAEQAPLQDDPEAQQDELAEARAAAESAAEQLQKLQEEIQKMEPQINDLAKLKELEQEQRELARQAADDAQKPVDPQTASTEKPDEQWRQQQEQVAEELRKETAQRPEAKAAALEQQAEAAKELAERAEQAAAGQEQLEELAEQVAQAGKPAEEPSGDPSGEQKTENGSPEQQEAKESAHEALREALREALADRQEEIAEQVAEKLAEARENRDASANVLPEAAAAAQQAAESLAEAGEKPGEKAGEQTGEQKAAEKAGQAAEALAEAEAAGEAGESPQAGEESGGEASPADAGESARAEGLADLAEQQQQLADALDAFAKGDDAAALEQLAEMEAAQAGELAADIASEPGLNNTSQPMKKAARSAESGAQQAGEAAESSGSGEAQAAADQHEAAAGKLGEAAEALAQASEQFAQQAEAAAAAAKAQPNPRQAPIPGEAMAEAFREASKAADAPSSSEAAGHAEAAAEALSQGAQAALSAMQGNKPSPPGQPPQPGPPGPPNPLANQPSPPGEPGEDTLRTPEADQGVPPELAKLGLSSGDWAQIQSALKAETGAGASIKVPEEYRGLVRSYFEQMAKGGEE